MHAYHSWYNLKKFQSVYKWIQKINEKIKPKESLMGFNFIVLHEVITKQNLDNKEWSNE